MKIDIDSEVLSEIVRADLSDTLKSLQTDLKRRKAGGTLAVFHMDKDEDVAELQRHIEAIKLVLRYYGEA